MTQPILWQPSEQRIKASRIMAFMRQVAKKHPDKFRIDEQLTPYELYAKLHDWSITEKECFWREVWDYTKVKSSIEGLPTLTHPQKMPGAKWFCEARLNYAENLLRDADDREALVFRGEEKVERRMTRAQLTRSVAEVAAGLRQLGVGQGDIVVALMPNMPETLIFMLAASSIGAVFSSASPDFGIQGIIDRFAQLLPKVLLAVEGYYYNGKTIDVMDKVREVQSQLTNLGLQQSIIVGYTTDTPAINGLQNTKTWQDFVAPHKNALLSFSQLPFDHPLVIMFSSGTTGVPKCIVHTAGGVLLQHLKEHQLHGDIHAGDRVFFFTTCSWMMWNWLVSALSSNATLLLYDGSPLFQQGSYLFDFLAAEKCTHFGTSAKFIDAIAKNNLSPIDSHQLENMRVIFSTGSTLTPESFEFVYQKIKTDVCLSSISGGTDLLSCFVLGCPILPVRRGEIQCRGLGMAVEIWAADDDGVVQNMVGRAGELVCTAPFPSMPLCFLNDENDVSYRAAYFKSYPNVWCHGDYCEQTDTGGIIIYGRSDATLNQGGIRIGTAEIYRQVEKVDAVLESLAVGQLWHGDERIVLFVLLREGHVLDDELRESIVTVIKKNTTVRHVPALILQVDDIPRTRSGKIVEIAVKNIIHNRPVKNIESLANPEALEQLKNLVALNRQQEEGSL